VHQLHAHHQVDVKEICRAGAVGANAACQGCQMDDELWAGIRQHALDVVRLHQVVVFDTRDEYIGPALA
jgi:type II secretory pathway component PulM